MNFQFYLEKLFASEDFEKFKKENKDAYLCSAFFSIDKKGKDNQQHLDFYVPSTKKLFSFKFGETVQMIPMDVHDERIPEKLSDNFNFNFSEIEKMVEDKMKEEKVDKQIEKLLFSLQKMDGKDFIIGTIFVAGLGILKVTVDLDEKKITGFEKKSFFDMMKIIKK